MDYFNNLRRIDNSISEKDDIELLTLEEYNKRYSIKEFPYYLEESLLFLNIDFEISLSELKTQYRLLAKSYHPDLNDSSTVKEMQLLNKHYSLIKDYILNPT